MIDSAAVPELLARLENLEVRSGFLDDHVQTLDATVAGHDRELLQLKEDLRLLRDALNSMRVAMSHDIQHEPPPPHY